MKLFKPHKYVQPEGDKNCILYNIANVLNIPLDMLDKYKVDGISTKDMEYIIQNIGFPKSYLAVLANITNVPGSDLIFLPEALLRFMIESTIEFTTDKNYLLMPLTIRTKNNRMHSIFLLVNKKRIILSDPRKTHMVELTLDELLPLLKCEQVTVLLSYRGFRKSYTHKITL